MNSSDADKRTVPEVVMPNLPIHNALSGRKALVTGANSGIDEAYAREAVREFKRRGVVPSVSCAAGKIICMSSVHEIIPWAGHVNYATSKGGIMMMMKSIAQTMSCRISSQAQMKSQIVGITPSWISISRPE